MVTWYMLTGNGRPQHIVSKSLSVTPEASAGAWLLRMIPRKKRRSAVWTVLSI